MGKLIDLTGQRFGKLQVVGKAPNDKYHNVRWFCHCDCGNDVIRYGHNLRDGKIVDCGCGNHSRAIKRNVKHGGRYTRLYQTWIDMIRRCEKTNYPGFSLYGAKGITVCTEWHNFHSFKRWAYATGYSDDLTIDRIKNDVGYSPENCRWTTWRVQENNRTNNTVYEYNGETHTLSEWAKVTGIHRATISRRILVYGWSIERALTEPVRKKIK